MMTFGIPYFFNDNIAAELILAATPHDVSLAGAGKISKIWGLPPTSILQYHLPMGAFKPYVDPLDCRHGDRISFLKFVSNLIKRVRRDYRRTPLFCLQTALF